MRKKLADEVPLSNQYLPENKQHGIYRSSLHVCCLGASRIDCHGAGSGGLENNGESFTNRIPVGRRPRNLVAVLSDVKSDTIPIEVIFGDAVNDRLERMTLKAVSVPLQRAVLNASDYRIAANFTRL